MKYRYSTKEGEFETNDWDEIPWNKLYSLNDKPAYEILFNGHKSWWFEGMRHRETGPARIWPNGTYYFYLNGKYYKDVNSWLEDNPNKEITFQAFMRLKYT